jgi:hypothetical protein
MGLTLGLSCRLCDDLITSASCHNQPLVFFPKEDIRFRPYYYAYEEQLFGRI